MTHPKQDIKLVEILQASCLQGDDPLRDLMVYTIQRVLEEELTAFLNAESYSRTEHRTGYRNGYKPRKLKTRVGRLELMVPKDREGVTRKRLPLPLWRCMFKEYRRERSKR